MSQPSLREALDAFLKAHPRRPNEADWAYRERLALVAKPQLQDDGLLLDALRSAAQTLDYDRSLAALEPPLQRFYALQVEAAKATGGGVYTPVAVESFPDYHNWTQALAATLEIDSYEGGAKLTVAINSSGGGGRLTVPVGSLRDVRDVAVKLHAFAARLEAVANQCEEE